LQTVVGLVVILGLAVGCGGGEEPSPKSGTSPAQEQSAAPTGQEAEKPTAVVTPPTPPEPSITPVQELRLDRELPDYYPNDAPRYPGSTASNFAQSPNGKANLLFGSDDPVDDVAIYMAKNLSENGWSTGESQPAPDGLMMQGNKGERTINIMIRRIDDGASEPVTMIAVLVDP
jgi:hypothetical protein